MVKSSITMIAKVCNREGRGDWWFHNSLVRYGRWFSHTCSFWNAQYSLLWKQIWLLKETFLNLSNFPQIVISEHQRVQEEMKEQQELDKKALEEKVSKDAKSKEAEETKRLEKEMTKVLSEKRTKQAAELAAGQDLSEDELRQIRGWGTRSL